MRRIILLALAALLPMQHVSAGVISAMEYADDTAFSAATGATTLTGALPDLTGPQGTSVTLGDATLTAGDNIFVGEGWSTLLPNQRAIAISDKENLSISINTGLSTAMGFYFHEPTQDTVQVDGCNATCVDSTFTIDFLLGGGLVDSAIFNPRNDMALFQGIILDTAFDQVKFTETTGGIDNEFFGEMFVARVPEPGMFGLLGLGLLAFAMNRRRGRE